MNSPLDLLSFIQAYPAYQSWGQQYDYRTTAVLVINGTRQELMLPDMAAHDTLIILVEKDAQIVVTSHWQANLVPMSYAVYLQENAHMEWFIAITQAATASYMMRIYGDGTGACGTVQLRYVGRGNDQLQIMVEQNHRASASKSSVTCRGILREQASVQYKGTISIPQHTGGIIEAAQEHTALMVSDQARVHSTPCLQVSSNNVRCKHATATSHINQEHIWYMQTRGIEEKSAQQLLLEGFCMNGIPTTSSIYHQFKTQLQTLFFLLIGMSLQGMEKGYIRVEGIKNHDDWQWLAEQAYNMRRKDLTLQFLEKDVTKKPAYEMLEKITVSVTDEREKNKVRGQYCDHLMGKIFYEQFKQLDKNKEKEKELEEHIRKQVAVALREVLQMKLVKEDPALNEKKKLVQESLQILGALKDNYQCLWSAWSLMTYHMKVKKWETAFKILPGCLLWNDYGGFTYTSQDMEYMFTDPNYKEFISLDDTKIPHIYHVTWFIYATSQLEMARLFHESKITVASLKEPLERAKKATDLVAYLGSSGLNDSLPVSVYWWKSELQRQYDVIELQEWLKMHAQNKKGCQERILTYLKDYPYLGVSSMATFIKQVIEPYQESVKNLDQTKKYYTLNRILAFKQFIDEKSSIEQKEDAIEKLRKLSESNFDEYGYAANTLGIICTLPKFALKGEEKKMECYRQMGISAFLRAYLKIEKQADAQRTSLIPARYFYMQGNPYVHGTLARAYLEIGLYDKMNEHMNDLLNTGHLGDYTATFLQQELEKLFMTWNERINLESPQSVTITKQFMSSWESKVTPYNVHLKDIAGYQLLMDKISKSVNDVH